MTAIQDILPRFTEADADRACDEWGSNCGPAALAVVAGLTLDEVRPHLGDFEAKRYTNPTLMLDSLRRLNLSRMGCCKCGDENHCVAWPSFGLARIQWEGPWTQPGVPIRARYRYTHWVASCLGRAGDVGIFDVNCLNNGSGWVSLADWSSIVVPHILKLYQRASGRWHITHSIEVKRPELSTNLQTSARSGTE
jgi:hypothetical protein